MTKDEVEAEEIGRVCVFPGWEFSRPEAIRLSSIITESHCIMAIVMWIVYT